MLIEPASKVSVPLYVVMRTLSKTAERVLFPAHPQPETAPPVELDTVPEDTQVLPVIFTSVITAL